MISHSGAKINANRKLLPVCGELFCGIVHKNGLGFRRGQGKMGFGIALAGGGIRGAAHVGVLRALEEAGLHPRSVAGTSAGGIIAGFYAAGVTPDEMAVMVQDAAKNGASFADPDIFGIFSIIPDLIAHRSSICPGLLKGDRMERYFAEQTGKISMHGLTMRTVIPAVDLGTGLTVAFTNSLFGLHPVEEVKWTTQALVSEAMRATSALPVAFQPKCLDGMCLVDGGAAGVLPVDLLLAAGEPNVLAVDVSEDYKMPKHFGVLDVASHSLSIMETRLRQCVTHGEKFLLTPELPETSGVLNLSQMEECMEAGYRSTKKVLPLIRKVLDM